MIAGAICCNCATRHRKSGILAIGACSAAALSRARNEVAALRRELYEELELEFAQSRLVTRFEFDLRPLGLDRYFRSYYEIALSAAELPRLVLHEGAAMRSAPSDKALTMKLVPYDGFALFLHHQQKRLIR